MGERYDARGELRDGGREGLACMAQGMSLKRPRERQAFGGLHSVPDHGEGEEVPAWGGGSRVREGDGSAGPTRDRSRAELKCWMVACPGVVTSESKLVGHIHSAVTGLFSFA